MNFLNWPKQSQLNLCYSVTSSRIFLPQLDEYFRLCTVVFDEVKITNVAKIDKKIDMLLGPGKQVSNDIEFLTWSILVFNFYKNMNLLFKIWIL